MTTPFTRRGSFFLTAFLLCIAVGSAVPAIASESAEADGHVGCARPLGEIGRDVSDPEVEGKT